MPAPGPGEVLVRTDLAAICGSDLHVAAQATGVNAPGFPGHEAVGEVLESRAPGFKAGDRVLCAPPAVSARCYAQFQVIGADAVVPLPQGRSIEELIVAQQLGTAVFAMKRFWPAQRPTAPVAAVLGAGPAGLAFVSLLKRAGFERVLVSDVAVPRLRAATQRGADSVVDAATDDPVEWAMRMSDGRGVDLVVEAAGRDITRRQAMTMVRDEGRIGLFGLEEDGASESTYPFAELFRRRPTIEMTWGAQFEPGLASFFEAVDLIATNRIEATGLVTDVLPLSRIQEAFDLAADATAGALKVAIDPTS